MDSFAREFAPVNSPSSGKTEFLPSSSSHLTTSNTLVRNRLRTEKHSLAGEVPGKAVIFMLPMQWKRSTAHLVNVVAQVVGRHSL